MTRVGTSPSPIPDLFAPGEPSAREKLEATISAALLKRARARLDGVRHDLDGTWRVLGQPKFGDTRASYLVTFPRGARAHCTCYDTNHGESRARKMCSHVLAVIIYREEASLGAGHVDSDDVDTSGGEEASVDTTGDLLPLDPQDPQLTPRSWQPPPAKLVAYREHQWGAACEIVDAFESGARVVYVDAPVGVGKTFLADLVARKLRERAAYVCTSKQLQDQILNDLPYARILRGRANYPTLSGDATITADDCDGTTPADNDCSFCDPMRSCPYRMAKQEAIRAQVAVLNTAYWLREANYVGAFGVGPKTTDGDGDPVDLLIIDECDTLESMMLGFIEFAMPPSRLRMLSLEAPKKGVHYATIAKWLQEDVRKAVEREQAKLPQTVIGRRQARVLQTLKVDALKVAAELGTDHPWVRENSDRRMPFYMKPVMVTPFGEQMIWRHAKHVLMMSGTIISADELRTSLGQDGPSAVVTVPMSFKPENRPIHVVPVANVTAKTYDEEVPKLVTAIIKIGERHPGERILVHTVSYKLADYLTRATRAQLWANQDRKVVTYTNAAERIAALDAFRASPGAVLFASSFDRGVDLADDDCRVIVVAKMPYPNMGDAQVSARANNGREGDGWYTVQTIRTLVQMTGRGVRHDADWCESYILDAQFSRKLYRNNKTLFPSWWRDALTTDVRVKELT